MKAGTRIIIKMFILLLVIALAGGGAAGLRAYRQSSAEYTMDRYLDLLLANDSDRAYALLDLSEDGEMSGAEYAAALEGKQYGLYTECKAEEIAQRRDNDGNEYVDYHVQFLDAEGEVQLEDDFTVKKQSEPMFGIFDRWKVLSGHCMVKNFPITVPAGSELYLNGEQADASWIVRDNVPLSLDCYQVPSLLPGKVALVVRHPALESVNTTLDTASGSADYSAQMTLKKSAQDACTELGVTALKQLYAAAVTGKTESLAETFASCQDAAEKFARRQGKRFNREGSVFRNVAVSDFAAQTGGVTFAEDESGAITTEMTLSYHYLLREDVTTDTEELQEDGTPVQETQTDSRSGDNTAKFTLAFANGAWQITSIDIPVVPESA